MNALDAGLLVDIAVPRAEDVSDRRVSSAPPHGRGYELTFFEVVPVGRWAEELGSVLSEEDHAALDRFVSGAPPPHLLRPGGLPGVRLLCREKLDAHHPRG